MTEEEALKIFQETDVNNDGKLDRDEYLTYVSDSSIKSQIIW